MIGRIIGFLGSREAGPADHAGGAATRRGCSVRAVVNKVMSAIEDKQCQPRGANLHRKNGEGSVVGPVPP